MTNDFTFTIIKPCAVRAGYTGQILADIQKRGFRIIAMKLTSMTRKEAETFYAIHREQAFFCELIDFMISGPIVAAILEKENAVADFRSLIGNTDPTRAEEGTLRKKYGQSLRMNAIHGSDSEENAKTEAACFFSFFERYRVYS